MPITVNLINPSLSLYPFKALFALGDVEMKEAQVQIEQLKTEYQAAKDPETRGSKILAVMKQMRQMARNGKEGLMLAAVQSDPMQDYLARSTEIARKLGEKGQRVEAVAAVNNVTLSAPVINVADVNNVGAGTMVTWRYTIITNPNTPVIITGPTTGVAASSNIIFRASTTPIVALANEAYTGDIVQFRYRAIANETPSSGMIGNITVDLTTNRGK